MLYDLSKMLAQTELSVKQENLVSMVSTVDVKEADLELDSPFMFDFDPHSNLLVLAQNASYHVFIGDEPEMKLAEKFAQWMEEDKPKNIVFSLAKTSILDNNIQYLAMKNMRLYLVDEEYSMIVFTITISA